MRVEVGAHLVERLPDPRLDRDRVQVVQEQQVRDELVLRQGVRERPVGVTLGDVVDEPREPLSIEVEQGLHDLHRRLPDDGVGKRLQALEEGVDLRDPLACLGVVHVDPSQPCCAPNIGLCTCLIVRPLPRYMCTPHGRHGSKLRTARMMSMPRNASWPFSSKMGWPVTASS